MTSAGPTPTARRLPPEARRSQLIDAAVAEIATRGWLEVSLDGIAERADVTRNLIYHYFPRGRVDLLVAAIERAGDELSAAWQKDPAVPLEQRAVANLSRIADHALAPSDIWLTLRQAPLAGSAEIERAQERFRGRIVEVIARNQLGTGDPPPIARLALRSYLDFVERALDEAREQGIGRTEILNLLEAVLEGVVAAAEA